MKYVWRIAFIGVFLAPVAKAEVATIKKKSTAKLEAFQNYEEKIAALEAYSVEYVNADHSTQVFRSAPARQTKSNDEMSVRLLRSKKKVLKVATLD